MSCPQVLSKPMLTWCRRVGEGAAQARLNRQGAGTAATHGTSDRMIVQAARQASASQRQAYRWTSCPSATSRRARAAM